MTKATFLFLLLWVFSAQSAISNNEGGPLIRAVRSPHCSECEGRGPPPPPPPPPGPPPPPPVFHTHQWTGVQRSDDGIDGVFSGAAAAADNGLQMAGRAFSLASSSLDGSAGATSGAAAGAAAGISAGAGLKTNIGTDGGQYSGGFNAGVGRAGVGIGSGVAYGADAGSLGEQAAQSSFGHSSAGYGGQSVGGYNGQVSGGGGGTQGYRDTNGNSANFGSGHGFKSFRESHYTYSGNKHFGGQAEHGQSGNQYGRERDVEQIQSGGFEGQSNANAQSSLYGGNGGGSSGYSAGFSRRGHGQYGKLSSGNEFSNEGQIQEGSAGYGRGQNYEQQLQTSGGGQWEAGSGSSAGATQQANEDAQSALNGAFGLAAQGVQASQQAQPGGCTTCGKSNYALSNAKSHSGNAVAVSVGG